MKLPFIYEDENFRVEQSQECTLPGYFVLHSKLKVSFLTQLNEQQLTALMSLIRKAQQIQQELLQPEKIYLCSFCEVNPILHYHLFPRTKALTLQYQQALNLNRNAPINGLQLMTWAKENYQEALNENERLRWHNQFITAFQTANA